MREHLISLVKLEAHFFNALSVTIELRCASVREYEAEYKSVVGADGSVARSLTMPRRFEVLGANPAEFDNIGHPTHLSIEITGEQKNFQISSIRVEGRRLIINVH